MAMPMQPIQVTYAGAAPSRPEIPRIDTERFYLRTLQPSDASACWQAWLADPEVMHPMNSKPRQVTLQQLRANIAKQDQVQHLLIGVFDRANDRHIGLYKIDVNRKHRLAAFNVMIGEKDYWGQKVVLETRAALLDYVFTKENIAKAVGKPPARNFPSVFNYRAQGWRLECVLKSHLASNVSPGRIDQLQFGLTKENWIALRAKRQSSPGHVSEVAAG